MKDAKDSGSKQITIKLTLEQNAKIYYIAHKPKSLQQNCFCVNKNLILNRK